MVRNQIRLAPMGEAISLDYNAVRFVLDLYEIEDKQSIFEKVLQCFDIEKELSR